MTSPINEHPQSIRIEIRMSDHTRVIELLPGDGGRPQIEAEINWNQDPVEVPDPQNLPFRHFEPGPQVDVTLKVTAGKMTYAREERPAGEGEG